jgi:HAT1-interacting factor 1
MLKLTELRKPPVDMNAALGQDNPLSGLLGDALGGSSLEEAKKNAKDLSGLVRKKAKAEPEESNGKRKAEEPLDEEEESKKAKVEESAAPA